MDQEEHRMVRLRHLITEEVLQKVHEGKTEESKRKLEKNCME